VSACRLAFVFAVAGVGCAPATSDTGGAAPTSAADPDVQAPDPEVPPDLPLVEAGLSELLGRLLDANPWQLADLQAETLAGGDDDCPSLEDMAEQQLFEGECTASTGVHYQGLSLSTRLSDVPIADGRTASDWYHLVSSLTVTWPDGSLDQIHADAELARVPAQGDQPRTTEIEIIGRAVSDRTAWADTWLAAGVDQHLDLTASWRDGAPGVTVELRQAWPEGSPGAALVEGFGVERTGADCAVAASRLRLWWPDRGWAEVTLDEGVAAACQACGPATAGGEPLGDACVDLAPLLDWQEEPW